MNILTGKALKSILLIGAGAREHAIADALCRKREIRLLVVAHNDNPGLASMAAVLKLHEETAAEWIADWAHHQAVHLAVIGLEDPLAVGLPDRLATKGIPTVGPSHTAAQLETSKLFARDLMRRHNIAGQVEYRYICDVDSLREYLASSSKEFALKPVGLTAGKGVQVMGEQLGSLTEAIAYGRKVITERIGGEAGIIVEERIVGPEFTLQAFVDGKTVLPMPLVRDFKRAFEGDQGPNTGGMGSYSQPDGLLPYVTRQQYGQAVGILRHIVKALRSEGIEYRGVMYGQFMMTREGMRLIEINARFGDPEAINVLALLENDFVDVCQAIVNGDLHKVDLRFQPKATVCKYIVPPGYGEVPQEGAQISLDRYGIESLGVKVYFAKVKQRDSVLLTTTSRAVALLGIGDSIPEAESAVDEALQYVEGDFQVRRDIGKASTLQSDQRRFAEVRA